MENVRGWFDHPFGNLKLRRKAIAFKVDSINFLRWERSIGHFINTVTLIWLK